MHLKSTTEANHVLTIILRIMVELIPILHCHTTLSTPKNASPQNTTGNCHTNSFLSLLSSPQSHHLHCLPLSDEGWCGVFFLYTSVSHSHLCPKFPRSAAEKLNYPPRTLLEEFQPHKQHKYTEILCLWCRIHTCHPVVKTTAKMKLRWEAQGYEERVFA